MRTKKIFFQSPVTNLRKQILVLEPNRLNKPKSVFVFFDGQIFQTSFSKRNSSSKINILKHLNNNNLQNNILVFVHSMTNSLNKYQVRKKELVFTPDQKSAFIKKALGEIKNYLQTQTNITNIFGFGFSLSGLHVLQNCDFFSHVVAVSPAWQVQHIQRAGAFCSVYYGQKEYKVNSSKRVNEPVKVFTKNNPDAKVIQYQKMLHTFSSWDKHFDHMLKSSVVALGHFQKMGINSVGQFIHDGSNVSFINQSKHLKIHFNNLRNMQQEMDFVIKTHYKNDYKILDNQTYVKKYYQGRRKKQLNNKDVTHLAKELKSLHALPVDTKTPRFRYKNFFDQEPFVMSHGDLNYKNVLFGDTRTYLIDFEWAMLHSFYWDIASVFHGFNLSCQQQKLFVQNYQLFRENFCWKKLALMTQLVKKTEKQFFKKHKNYFLTNG